MGIVKTLNAPYVERDSEALPQDYAKLLTRLQDDIVMKFSSLIADVELGNVGEQVLKREIDKLVDGHKGIFNVEDVKHRLFTRLFGYGMLQKLIEDENISDIDVLRYDYIVIKYQGEWQQTSYAFEDELTFERYCKLLIIRNGGVLNAVDSHCRVSDHKYRLRINASIAPRNVSGPTLNIRKHRLVNETFASLRDKQMYNEFIQKQLYDINQKKRNVIICGKGASGKTTLLRAILEDVDNQERVLICEADVELYPQKKNIITQTIKKAYLGGRKRELSELISDGLTMSLDTYCIGEITGDEAWDLIQAGHTDHRILATVHANGPEDVFYRLLALIESRTRLNEDSLMRMMSRCLDVIVYMKGFKVECIVSVAGYDEQRRRPILEVIS